MKADGVTWVRRLALTALALQMLLVVTGTAVRVTGSGLGCPTWPRCTGTSLTNTAALGGHGFIEFGNRLLAVVLELVGIALVLAVRRVPHPRAWFRLALVQASVVPLQAVVGGLLVLSGLNPYVLIAHFLASFPLVYAAAALVHRTRVTPPPAPALLLRPLTGGLLAAISVVLVLGTLVTGTGPHAGDPKVDRLPFNPRDVTQLHADGVFLLLGLTLATLVVTWRTPWRRWGLLLVGLIVAQGTLGYLQYFNGVPAALVAMHTAGATLVFTTAAWLHVSLARPSDARPRHTAAPTPEPVRGTATAR